MFLLFKRGSLLSVRLSCPLPCLLSCLFSSLTSCVVMHPCKRFFPASLVRHKYVPNRVGWHKCCKVFWKPFLRSILSFNRSLLSLVFVSLSGSRLVLFCQQKCFPVLIFFLNTVFELMLSSRIHILLFYEGVLLLTSLTFPISFSFLSLDFCVMCWKGSVCHENYLKIVLFCVIKDGAQYCYCAHLLRMPR